MDLVSIISLVVGILGTAISIYQAALIRSENKRKGELQYILAGINNAAIAKQQSWQNQLSNLKKLESDRDWEIGRLYLKARDDFTEIVGLATSLEGAIDTNNSAIRSMMERTLEMTKLNNKIQEEGLKNPLIKPAANEQE